MYELNETLIQDEIKNSEEWLPKLNKMRQDLMESMEQADSMENPDAILYRNIERAERMLDKLEIQLSEVSDGKIARLYEVTSTLLNAITGATTSIVGSRENDQEMMYKMQLLELKNKELEIKNILAGKGQDNGKTVNNNTLIVTDREEVLKLIKSQQSIGENNEGTR